MDSKKAALSAFSKNVRAKYGESVKDIILYGSAARGEEREDSDLDVVVVVEGDAIEAWRRMSSMAVDVMLETGRYISVQVLSPEDLGRRHNPYIMNVLNEGIRIA